MTKDEIEKLASDAGFCVEDREDGRLTVGQLGAGDFIKFAKLVAEHEREACIDIVLRSVSGSMREDLNCYEAVEKIRALK